MHGHLVCLSVYSSLVVNLTSYIETDRGTNTTEKNVQLNLLTFTDSLTDGAAASGAERFIKRSLLS